MRFYGMPYREVMNLPMPVFWHLSGMVERLVSAEAKRSLQHAATAQHDPKAAAELWATLDKASPDPVILTGHARMMASAVPDEGAFDELRGLAG